MTTMLDQIQRVRRLMYGGFRYPRNKMAGTMNNSETEITLAYPQTGIGRGSTLNIGIEKMLVWDWNGNTLTATVERGIEGSGAIQHVEAFGDSIEVEVNPRFAGWDIACAVVDAIHALPDTVWPERELEIEAVAGQTVLDLDDNEELPGNLVSVRQHRSYSGVENDTQGTFDIVPLIRNSNLVHDMTTRFGSRGAVRLGAPVAQNGTVVVTYTYPFTVPDPMTEGWDLVDYGGFAVSQLDLPALGAAVALTQALEVERSDTTAQGEPRRAEEVPPMYASQMSDAIQRRYDRRVREETFKMVARRGIKS